MQGIHLRKYGAATTVNFDLYAADGIDLSIAATFAAGDVKIMKDEGAEANITTLPVDEGQGYSVALSATEMQAARIVIYVVDLTATKVWLDKVIVIETYGHASAQHSFDLDSAGVDATQINSNATAAANLALSALGIVSGSFIGTPTTTAQGTDLSPPTSIADFYAGSLLIITSGAAAGERVAVTAWAITGSVLTTDPLATAPASGDTFVLV